MALPLVSIINGPNLNLLGKREPEIYGHETLEEIEAICRNQAARSGMATDFFQSNHEGAIVDKLHEARESSQGVIINAAAYTHTSVAIMDALLALEVPVIELHLTNTHRREKIRARSYVSKAATGIICGFGADGYALSIMAMERLIKNSRT